MTVNFALPNVPESTIIYHAAVIASRRADVASAKMAVRDAIDEASRQGVDGKSLHDLLKLTPARLEADEDRRVTRAVYATALQIPWLHASPPSLMDIMTPDEPEVRAENARRTGFWGRVLGEPNQPPYDDDRATSWTDGWSHADALILAEICRDRSE